MLSKNVSAVKEQTRVIDEDYLSRSYEVHKRARFNPGEKKVIGTSSLFKREKIISHMFDENRVYLDDVDLCEQMSELEDAKF